MQLQSVLDLDQKLAALNHEIDALRNASAAAFVPPYTQPVSALLTQWLLTPQDRERLDGIRTLAVNEASTGRDHETSQTLKPAAELLDVERTRLRLIKEYFHWQQRATAHATFIKPLFNASQPEQQDAARLTLSQSNTHVSATMQQVLETADSQAGDAVHTLDDTVKESLRLYNRERSSLAEHLGEPAPSQAVTFKRTSPCPTPAASTSGGSIPKLIPMPGPDLYPPEMRAWGIEGTIVVRVMISNTGCETGARVVRSSGVPQLDAAALTWTQRNTFLPAESNGQAIASEANYKVNFDLKD